MEDYFCLLEKTQTEVIHSSAKAKGGILEYSKSRNERNNDYISYY